MISARGAAAALSRARAVPLPRYWRGWGFLPLGPWQGKAPTAVWTPPSVRSQ